MLKIEKIEAKEILDSRGNPTVETVVTLTNGVIGQASVPAGASTGVHEAKALPAEVAIDKVNGELRQALVGQEFDQTTLDEKMIELDGTENKNRLGANAILSVSLAFARASVQANSQTLYEYLGSLCGHPVSKTQLPRPMFNILNGGRHADSVDWQEFMVVPVGAQSFAEGFDWIKKVYAELKQILEAQGLSVTIGDEGGFAPKLERNVEALDLLVQAITQAGFKPARTTEAVQSGGQIALALDVAASEFKQDNKYVLTKEGGRVLSAEEMIAWYEELLTKYPIISIEDGLAQDDWTEWQALTTRLGDQVNLVGDDLFVTNPHRLKQGLDQKVANAILIKPNQIGTLTETLKVIEMAKTAGYKTIISHRSGETLDSFIADLAVGAGADFIKAGAPARPERLAKYDRLLAIEHSSTSSL